MQITPKISVIIVTYNAANTLELAIKSYINQDYRNKELVIIDGGSKDDTISIINKYKNCIDYIVSEPDNGIYDAMNKGWKAATGDYIYYLGADDQLLDGGLSVLGNAVTNEDIIYGDIRTDKGKGKIIDYRSTLPISEICNRPVFSHQSVIMKKQMIESLNGFNCKYQILADYDLELRAYLNGATTKYAPGFVALYSMGGFSAYNPKSAKERLAIQLENGHTRHPYKIYCNSVLRKLLLKMYQNLLFWVGIRRR